MQPGQDLPGDARPEYGQRRRVSRQNEGEAFGGEPGVGGIQAHAQLGLGSSAHHHTELDLRASRDPTAGFAEVRFTDVQEPVYYGPDAPTALDAVLRLLKFDALLADLDAAAAEQARTRLRATLDAHATDGGVYFDSRAWIVTARRHH